MNTGIGRPTKYNDELQAQADRYVYEWAEIGDVVPSRVGLCCFLGINKSTSYEWEQLYPDFSNTLGAVDALQERESLNGGLSSKMNSTIVKLLLANHGYSDKQAVDHSSTDGSMTPTRELTGDALRKELDRRGLSAQMFDDADD